MLSQNSQPGTAKTPPPAEHKETLRVAFSVVAMRRPKLNLGQIVITSNAHSVLTTEEVTAALHRHQFGDWGTVCAEDWKTNDCRCRDQGMVLSAYESAKGTPFWVVSDPGHEVTTVLLPEDY